MNKEQIIKDILEYEKELRLNYEELRDAFGSLDSDTQRAFLQWNVIDELLTRININK
jgi:hypothetical protein